MAAKSFASEPNNTFPVNSNDAGFNQQRMMSIAAGHPTPENISPGVTSVITSEDIDRIGARRVTDVLEYLPGVHVGRARTGFNVIGFRGVYSEGNQQVLVMVNGTPIRNPNTGGKPWAWNMPVKNIDRIEVIRGAGSMLYGADATNGVINIILKTGKDLQGGNVGGFFGSQDTYEGWAQYGKKQGDWEYSVAFQGGATNGDKGRIDRDAQTLLDTRFGTHVSNAPGYTNNGRNDIDARIDLAYKDTFRVRGGYQGFGDIEIGTGNGYALDKLGSTQADIYTLDLTLRNKISDYFQVDSKLYFYGESVRGNFYRLPPGTLGGLLPFGVRSVTTGFVNTSGLTTQANYNGIENHTITAGTGFLFNWLTPGTHERNFILNATEVKQIPLTKVTDLEPWARPPGQRF